MGGITPLEPSIEPRTSSVNLDAIAVASQDEIQEDIVLQKTTLAASSNDYLLVGSVADLLEEIKTLIQLISEYKSTKPESREFFHALFIRYPQLAGTTYQEAVSLYICETARSQVSFDLTHSEVSSWWKQSPS
jgi:hypothetical protein